VIVVVGDPSLRPAGATATAEPDGPAAAIARACALAGATVQVAGKVGDDPPGDEILLGLTRHGIGHVALLRDAGAITSVGQLATTPISDEAVAPDDLPDADAELDPSEPTGAATDHGRPPAPVSMLAPEDLDLALRYLSTFTVLIVAQPLQPATLAVAIESAAYSGAHLILIDATEAEAATASTVPVDDITALESPPSDPDGDFAGLVGRYAAALDGGTPAAAAFRTALGAAGWESATP
jgi:sugar/nucleoside kinase (ribokinase family)